MPDAPFLACAPCLSMSDDTYYPFDVFVRIGRYVLRKSGSVRILAFFRVSSRSVCISTNSLIFFGLRRLRESARCVSRPRGFFLTTSSHSWTLSIPFRLGRFRNFLRFYISDSRACHGEIWTCRFPNVPFDMDVRDLAENGFSTRAPSLSPVAQLQSPASQIRIYFCFSVIRYVIFPMSRAN